MLLLLYLMAYLDKTNIGMGIAAEKMGKGVC